MRILATGIAAMVDHLAASSQRNGGLNVPGRHRYIGVLLPIRSRALEIAIPPDCRPDGGYDHWLARGQIDPFAANPASIDCDFYRMRLPLAHLEDRGRVVAVVGNGRAQVQPAAGCTGVAGYGTFARACRVDKRVASDGERAVALIGSFQLVPGNRE